jgi:hypothetical protein
LVFHYPKIVITPPKLLFPDIGPVDMVSLEGFTVTRRRMFWGSIVALGLFSLGFAFAQGSPAQSANSPAHPASAITSQAR